MTVMEQSRSAAGRPLVDGWLASWNIETALYVLVGAAAIALRIVHLGDAPLSAAEAREALSVWRFVSMSDIAPAQPVSAAWYTLTALTFFLFGASEFWARFWPMAAGCALVFAPLLFRRGLGRGATLAACGILAISPTMLAASRTADGTTLAALSLMIGLAGVRRFFEHGSSRGLIAAGCALGFGLATGPRFISAIAASSVALLLVLFARPDVAHTLRTGWQKVRPQAWSLLAASGVTFVVFASAGALSPSGLSAAGAAVPHWLNGWVPSAEASPIWLVPQLLFVNEPLLLVLGSSGLYVAFVSEYWHSLTSRVQMIVAAREPDMESALAAGGGGLYEAPWRGAAGALGAAALGTLLFGILYVGREASDALWVVLPLAMLSGKVIVEVFSGEWFEGERETVLAQAAVLFVMLVFVYFQLAAFGRGYLLIPDRALEIRLGLAGGVIALAIFVTIMFALGWSRLSAVRGAMLALGAAATLGTLGAGIGMTQWRASDPNDLWMPATTASSINLMMETLRDISDRAAGDKEDIKIAVVSFPAVIDQEGLLGWELRNFTQVRYVDSPGSASESPIVIADSSVTDPAFGSAYVGESFPIQARQLQAEPTLQGLVNWWLYRTWPTEFSHSVTLWVRADVHQLIKQR